MNDEDDTVAEDSPRLRGRKVSLLSSLSNNSTRCRGLAPPEGTESGYEAEQLADQCHRCRGLAPPEGTESFKNNIHLYSIAGKLQRTRPA